MKFVAVFLACIVAAQAATFACPSYDYWCSHSFHVLPPRHFYCYTVPFKSCWCTSQYYANCLAEFPQKKDPSCEDEIKDMDAFIAVYENKLLEARKKIEKEMNEGLAAFIKQIDDLHASYITTFKLYLKNCYAENSAEYIARVESYIAELAAAKTRALTNFANSVSTNMLRIKAFHDRIIANFRSCLEGRVLKISAYNTKMDSRATEIKKKYSDCLKAMVKKRISWVTKIFEKLYAGTTKTAKDAMAKYECDLIIQIAVFTNQFNQKVDAAVKEMKENYRCNYKCFFQTGCFGFSRRSFSRSCVRFPTPPKYNFKFFGMCAFNADWNGCAYSCLRTCTVAEKNPTFDDQTHIDAIKVKTTGYKNELAAKVAQWKKQIAEWKVKAQSELSEKIICLIPRTYCGTAPTQVEIDAFHQQLQAQAQTWIDLKEKELLAQVASIETRITARINSWHISALAYISRIKEQFNCCVNNRNAKIISYNACLAEKRKTQRAQLLKRLTAHADQHKCVFDRFYECSFSDLPEEVVFVELKAAYKACVDQKVLDVLAKFDAFWDKWEPQLKEHYCCGFKCMAKVTTPCLNLCYNWNFCAPSIRSCRFLYC